MTDGHSDVGTTRGSVSVQGRNYNLSNVRDTGGPLGSGAPGVPQDNSSRNGRPPTRVPGRPSQGGGDLQEDPLPSSPSDLCPLPLLGQEPANALSGLVAVRGRVVRGPQAPALLAGVTGETRPVVPSASVLAPPREAQPLLGTLLVNVGPRHPVGSRREPVSLLRGPPPEGRRGQGPSTTTVTTDLRPVGVLTEVVAAPGATHKVCQRPVLCVPAPPSLAVNVRVGTVRRACSVAGGGPRTAQRSALPVRQPVAPRHIPPPSRLRRRLRP